MTVNMLLRFLKVYSKLKEVTLELIHRISHFKIFCCILLDTIAQHENVNNNQLLITWY